MNEIKPIHFYAVAFGTHDGCYEKIFWSFDEIDPKELHRRVWRWQARLAVISDVMGRQQEKIRQEAISRRQDLEFVGVDEAKSILGEIDPLVERLDQIEELLAMIEGRGLEHPDIHVLNTEASTHFLSNETFGMSAVTDKVRSDHPLFFADAHLSRMRFSDRFGGRHWEDAEEGLRLGRFWFGEYEMGFVRDRGIEEDLRKTIALIGEVFPWEQDEFYTFADSHVIYEMGGVYSAAVSHITYDGGGHYSLALTQDINAPSLHEYLVALGKFRDRFVTEVSEEGRKIIRFAFNYYPREPEID
jgi:hypothetical protein